MKNVIILSAMFICGAANAQPNVIQPTASGDYWRIDEYNAKLREFANQSRRYPAAVVFPSGSIGIVDLKATRQIGANEIAWTAGEFNNISRFYIEYSRDDRNWEQAGEVYLKSVNGDRYVFDHTFNDNRLVYYRIAVVDNNGRVITYTPSVQLRDEEYSTKVYPTAVRGGTFNVYIARPYEKLEVVNTSGQAVYEKGIENVTGNITVALPNVPMGVYFVQLQSRRQPQYVQKIVVE